jgi:hypothetical protein
MDAAPSGHLITYYKVFYFEDNSYPFYAIRVVGILLALNCAVSDAAKINALEHQIDLKEPIWLNETQK